MRLFELPSFSGHLVPHHQPKSSEIPSLITIHLHFCDAPSQIGPILSGWCSTPNQLLICSSFSRENGHPLLICSPLSTAQLLMTPSLKIYLSTACRPRYILLSQERSGHGIKFTRCNFEVFGVTMSLEGSRIQGQAGTYHRPRYKMGAYTCHKNQPFM